MVDSIISNMDFMSNAINLVLFGKTGNGKSATGNSILGRNAFLSKPSLFGVTRTCELQSTELKDGRFLNVIDTPEMFDRSDESESTCKEFIRCVNLAKNGIHAILVVFSVRSLVSPNEEAAIESLKTIFGENIFNHMIVVFTGGDDLESFGASHDEFLVHNVHRPLQKFIQSCNSRIVFFDNKTCDEDKRAKQLEDLMNLVDTVVENNFGKPFSNDIFEELKLLQKQKEVESMEGCSDLQISVLKQDVQLARSTEKYEVLNQSNSRLRTQVQVEQRLKQNVVKHDKRLAEEKIAWHEAEEASEQSWIKSEEENSMPGMNLEPAEKRSEKFVGSTKRCAIL